MLLSYAVELFGLNFIKIRDGENHPLLTSKISWDGVTDIMCKYGTGSADAMIVNLLLSSRIDLVATSDGDIQFLSSMLSENGKKVVHI